MPSIQEIKSELDELKTEKAVLENKRDEILKSLKRKYGYKTLKEAKEDLPRLEKEQKELEKQRDLLIAESEQLLDQFEESEI